MGQSIMCGSGSKMPGQWRLIDLAKLITIVMTIGYAKAAREGVGCFPEGNVEFNHDDCSSFLMCNHQRYIKMLCPKLLRFDPTTKTCNLIDRIPTKGPCRVNKDVEETEVEDYIDYGNGDYVRIENDRNSNGNDIAQFENDQNDINREPIISQNDKNNEDDSYYDDNDEEYYDESYEEPDDYKNEYFEDYKVTRKEIDETNGLEGSRCSPEGKLTHNPNDCASFLVCNHKKYMVRPCTGGLLFDPKYRVCNRPESIVLKVNCKLRGTSNVIEKLSMKPKSKRIGAHKKSAHKKAAHKKVKRPRPAKSPQIKQTSDSGPNLDFKFFPIRS